MDRGLSCDELAVCFQSLNVFGHASQPALPLHTTLTGHMTPAVFPLRCRLHADCPECCPPHCQKCAASCDHPHLTHTVHLSCACEALAPLFCCRKEAYTPKHRNIVLTCKCRGQCWLARQHLFDHQDTSGVVMLRYQPSCVSIGTVYHDG